MRYEINSREKLLWRKKHYIITGDTRLNGLSKKAAQAICKILKSEGICVHCHTEFYYRDICGSSGDVSTDSVFWPNRYL